MWTRFLRIAPWVVLALCLAATLAGWAAARRSLEARAVERIGRAGRQTAAALKGRLRDYEDLARAAAGFYAGSDDVTPEEFRRFVDTLEFPRRDPAFVSLAFIEPVGAAEIPAWVEARRRSGTPVELQKADAAGESFLIRLFAPPPVTGAVVGWNAGANPVNRATLEAARSTDEARLAGPLPLAQFPSDSGAAVQQPVRVTVAGRREFRGWMSIMFRFGPLMEEALLGADPEIVVTLRDGPSGLVLFRSAEPTGAWPARVETPVSLDGRAFTLALSPSRGFAASVGTIRPPATLAAGLLGSALLFGIVWSLGSMERRAARLAEEMTASLRQSRERYRRVIETSQDGLLFFDLVTRRILETNPALRRLLDYGTEELAAMTLYDIAQDDRALVDESLRRLEASRALTLEDGVYRKKDGTTLAVAIDAVVFEEGGRPIVFNAVKSLGEKQLLEAQLRQAQKMEAVGRLAGGVAHDFNNILTAILGYSELILADDPPEDVRQNVEEVRKAADRAAALTRQLLAFSRKQVLQPTILELNDVVRNLDPMLRRVLRENVRIVLEPDPHLWRVKADPGQIEQVLINLAVNASDAMPAGGALTIRTGNRTVRSGDVGGIPVLAGEYVVLDVADTGHGMDAETLAHAFEPFFTTKERGKGTGLGLATVYGVVKQSGGYVQALSEPGKGATFRIYLPREHGPADSPSNVSPRPVHVRASETILLVEDEEAVRRLAETVLRARGYQVLVAETAETALELARAHAGRIHLLLSDVVLPGMDGHRLAATLRAERPDLAVLLASGYFDAGEGVDAKQQLLRKPFTPDALVDAVRSALRRARAR